MTSTVRPSRRPVERVPQRGAWRRHWKTASIAAIALLGLVIGLVGYTPLLGVRSIAVVGTHQLSQAQVLQAAGITRGTPLIRLDTKAIAARIETYPSVRSVRVITSLPSSVKITVIERTAVGYYQDAAVYRLVDGYGVTFAVAPGPPKDLPRIDATPGSPAANTAAAVAATLSAVVARSVSSITVASQQSITLNLTDGRIIFWGGTDRGNDKARLLEALMHQTGGYFDLSDPDAVISRAKP